MTLTYVDQLYLFLVHEPEAGAEILEFLRLDFRTLIIFTDLLRCSYLLKQMCQYQAILEICLKVSDLVLGRFQVPAHSIVRPVRESCLLDSFPAIIHALRHL